MPTYSFLCESCGATKELVMSISEFELCTAPDGKNVIGCDRCPTSKPMRVQLYAAPVIFKGSGWTPKYSK